MKSWSIVSCCVLAIAGCSGKEIAVDHPDAPSSPIDAAAASDARGATDAQVADAAPPADARPIDIDATVSPADARPADAAAATPDAAAPDAAPPPDASVVAIDTTITSGPPPITDSPNATFTFTSNTPGATFTCSLDGAPFTTCTTPTSYTVPSGTHTFAVVASAGGHADPTPATLTWTVMIPDATPPGIAFEPPTPTQGAIVPPTPQFQFGVSPSEPPTTTYGCHFDDQPVFSCTLDTAYSPSTPLPTGPHTFTVTATDTDGNTTTIVRDVVVDATLPGIAYVPPTPPEGATVQSSVIFEYHDSPPEPATTTYTCQYDAEPTFVCSPDTMYTHDTPLSDGPHKFTVVATNLAGAHTTIVRHVIIDGTAPGIAFTTPPTPAEGATVEVGGETPFFEFHVTPGEPPSTTYVCHFDGEEPFPCRPNTAYPHDPAYTGAQDGPHSFIVVATDGTNNTRTIVRHFVVAGCSDCDPPIVTTLVPVVDGNGVTVSFTLTHASTVLSVHCIVDGVDSACGTGKTGSLALTDLAPGVHDIQVYGIDQFLNSGQSASPGPAPAVKADASFTVTFCTGRAILIGHNFAQVGVGPLATPVQAALANAVRASQAVNLTRGVRVLGFHPATVDQTSCDNAIQAIDDGLGGPGSATCASPPAWYDEISDPDDLAARLRGHDVLLIHDLHDPTLSCTLGATWYDILQAFLNAGGVVVVLDGSHADPLSGPRVADGTSSVLAQDCGGDEHPPVLLQLAAAVPDVNPQADGDDAVTYQPDDPVAAGLPGDYVMPEDSVGYVNVDPFAVDVATTTLTEAPLPPCTMYHQVCAPTAVVIDKPFPDPVAVSVKSCTTPDDPDLCPREQAPDHTGPVVFIGGCGQIVMGRDLGGTAIANLPGGGSVTAATTPPDTCPMNVDTCSFTLGLTTFLGVKPGDNLQVGGFVERPACDGDGADCPLGGFSVTTPDDTPAPPDGFSDLTCHLGTDRHARDNPPGEQTSSTANETLAWDIDFLDDTGVVNGLCIARVDGGDPLLYNTIAGQALDGSTTLPPWDSSAWITPTTFEGLLDITSFVAPLPPPTATTRFSYSEFGAGEAGLYVGHHGLDYQERVSPFGYQISYSCNTGSRCEAPGGFGDDPVPLAAHFTPGAFAENSEEVLRFPAYASSLIAANSVTGATTTYSSESSQHASGRARVLTLSSDFVFDSALVLPFVRDILVDASTPQRPSVSLVSRVALGADGAALTFLFTSALRNHQWTFVFPGDNTFIAPDFNAATQSQLGTWLPSDPDDFTQFRATGYAVKNSLLGGYDGFRAHYPFDFSQGLLELANVIGAVDQLLVIDQFAHAHSVQPATCQLGPRGSGNTCTFVNGIQWCYDPNNVDIPCDDICANLGLVVDIDDTTWFDAQDTLAECQQISNALGFGTATVGDYALGCVEVIGSSCSSSGPESAQAVICSTDANCPLAHRTSSDTFANGEGYRGICPCGFGD